MRILAIEIGDGELRAARALRTFGAARLAGVERIPFADASELRAALERLAAWHPQVVVALAPAALVTHRILTLPFGSRRRVAATLPLELLGQLPAALGGAPPTIVATGADRARIAAALDARPLADVDDACAVVAGAATGGRHGVAFDLGLRPSGASLRRVAALAVVAMVLVCLDLGLARYDLTRRDAALVAAIERPAAEAMPGTRLVAPRAQLEAAVGGAVRQRTRLGGGTTVLEILREVSSRVPPSVSLDLDQLTIEGERLDLRGHAASFDTVDALRRALASAPFLSDVTADETRATVDGRGVEFRLHAARRPSGASS